MLLPFQSFSCHLIVCKLGREINDCLVFLSIANGRKMSSAIHSNHRKWLTIICVGIMKITSRSKVNITDSSRGLTRKICEIFVKNSRKLREKFVKNWRILIFCKFFANFSRQTTWGVRKKRICILVSSKNGGNSN